MAQNNADKAARSKSARRMALEGLPPYERLLQEVLRGEILPGEALTEMALAERLRVSRTPIREALTRLEQDGLVKRTSRGMVIRERSPEEILDIYEVRVLLEADAARLAAERRSSLDVFTLRRTAGELEQMDTSDPDAMAEANREFHHAVWRAAHSEPIWDLLRRVDMHLARYPTTTLVYPGRWETSLTEHRLLVAAIDERDGEKAAQASTHHFNAARDIRLTLWSEGQF
jgi:DNA-binding GntR family transcriptional regulator